MNTQPDKSWIAGMLVALTASLCCIAPVLALISGLSGIAATFSWLEPTRPYLIGMTTLVLGFAWYQKLKPRQTETVKCDCETDSKTSFWHTKTFLGIVTVIAIALLAFPSYAHIFYPKSPIANVIIVEKSDLLQIEFKISGMTCQGCAEHVNHALDGVPGVLEHNTSYEQGMSLVKFDGSKVNEQTLVDAIDATGYTVTERKIIDIK